MFDCADPDRLADFWAATLHYEKQPPPAGYASWDAFLEAMHVPEAERNDASAIVDPQGRGPRIYFQKMDTPKLAKNRLHLDVNAGGGGSLPLPDRRKRVDTEVERLLRLGAVRQRAESSEGEYWVVLTDPEGNEFCVQ